MRYLSVDDIEACMDYHRALDALSHAYWPADPANAAIEQSINMGIAGGYLRVLASSIPDLKVFGYKAFRRVGQHVRYAIHLFDATSGAPLAVLDAAQLTAHRTGATAALAAAKIVGDTPVRLGVIGSGLEAVAQLKAFTRVLDVASVRVFSPTAANRERFAEKLRAGGLDARAEDSAAAALAAADVAVAATNSAGTGPVLRAADLGDSVQYVSSIGSTRRNQRELHESVFEWADAVVVDTPAAVHESGDLVAAVAAGMCDPDRVIALTDIAKLTDRATTDPAATLYKSIGSGVQDIAVADMVYRAAVAIDAGAQLMHELTVKEMK